MPRPILAALAGAVLMATTVHAADERGIESPSYDVVTEADGVELRAYAPHLAAEVTVEADSLREASSRGFRPLAGYIFGNNRGSDEIAMTAPVTTQPATDGTKIAMTAPVSASGDGEGRYTVRFTMPSKWTMETLPTPNDASVTLIEVPGERRVAYRFTGARSQERVDAATAKVEAFLAAQDLTPASAPILAGYDGPSVPVADKRWEVMVIVE